MDPARQVRSAWHDEQRPRAVVLVTVIPLALSEHPAVLESLGAKTSSCRANDTHAARRN